MDKYKRECQKINEQITPRDEFMENLKSNLNKRMEDEKKKRNSLISKVAMIFVVLSIISSGVFAKDIGDWLSQLFSNTDEAMQIAIDNGYVQNVEMDYVEHDGIGIKVNSLIIDDNKINIVFDVKGEIDGELGIEEIFLSVGENDYDRKNLQLLSSSYSRESKSLSKNSHLLILKISNIDYNFKNGESLEIILNKLWSMKKEKIEKIDYKWKCNILLESDNFKNNENLAIKYKINSNEYLENYEINTTNTSTNIKLYFNNSFDKHNLIRKENIYIETENGQKFLCRECFGINDNMIQMNIPITIYDNIEKFNIIINLENEKIILNAQKENS